MNGVTGDSVPGARIHHLGSTYSTDHAGDVEMSVACAEALIVASGFLERKLNCLLRTVAAAALPVTLWPAPSEAERAAIRAAVFPSGQLSGNSIAVVVSDTFSARRDVVDAWRRAAATLAEATRGRWNAPVAVAPATHGASGELYIVDRPPPSPCSHGWFRWTAEVAGFCWERGPDYFDVIVSVADDLAARDDIALRALAYGAGLRPHPGPGLMNASHPAPVLSDFERGLLAMVGQRRMVRWPDDDTCQWCQ